MIPLRFVVMALASTMTGGCASVLTEDAPSAPAAIATTATVGAATAPEVAPAPLLTVDANRLSQLPTITCRDMLKPGSNVIVTQCMTREGWKAYERREAQEAQEIVRMLQGSRYR